MTDQELKNSTNRVNNALVIRATQLGLKPDESNSIDNFANIIEELKRHREALKELSQESRVADDEDYELGFRDGIEYMANIAKEALKKENEILKGEKG